ncbi:hypothetical protein VNO77_09182 [Canavalia gladiata]|uniref:AB hydrolase-1 domain-containing protein n=1 Tax=Canavalia gladiata TaxID=3824 RepID=A0AAN9QWF9_CANGL
MTFMDSLPPNEKVILVAHSFGGIAISVAMEKFPHKISVAVFLIAYVIGENLNFTTLNQEVMKRAGSFMDTQYFFFDGLNKPPTAFLFGPKLIASKLYQLSPSQDLTLALSLVRPHPFFSGGKELLKETAVTKQRNGRVPKVFIITKRDKIITEGAQRWIIERAGPYAEVKVIKDSDHMAMISQPKKLSSHILKIAHKY